MYIYIYIHTHEFSTYSWKENAFSRRFPQRAGAHSPCSSTLFSYTLIITLLVCSMMY